MRKCKKCGEVYCRSCADKGKINGKRHDFAKSSENLGEIAAACGLSIGGSFVKILEELEQCGFVRSFREPGRKTKGTLFQLIDNFTLFHRRFVDGAGVRDGNFWQNSVATLAANVWRRLAFERLCLQHIPQIRRAPGIAGVLVGAYSWRHVGDDIYPRGAQIDLLLDRADGIVNLCEMKWSAAPFGIDKETAAGLMAKAEAFRRTTNTRKGVQLTLVSPFGVERTLYRHAVQSVVTLNDLFT